MIHFPTSPRTGFLALALMAATAPAALADTDGEPRSMTIYDNAIFYDGYQMEKIIDADKNDGILRLRNSLYSVRLTDGQLNWFGEDLGLNVIIHARCDNYDRIGNVNIAFTPKGAETYDWETATRVEIARYITPFMNKNKSPKEVPYDFNVDAASLIFRDSRLREKYDMWLELELFGVPYAANEQVIGCKDRNDVFGGTLSFSSYGEPAATTDKHVFVPIVIKRPEYQGHNLNNYSERGTDEIGRCIKTWTFEVPEDVADGRITFIISNHGANAGGEEYVRRLHLISVDGEEKMQYTPGGVTCEPYRVYNTQPNGIYGNKRTDASWQRSSNWCPGALIPIRELDLGPMKKGTHTFTVEVPKAKFKDGQGDFPVSAYFQGLTEGTLPVGLYTPRMLEPETTVTVDGDAARWSCDREVSEAILYSTRGEMLRIVNGAAGEMPLSLYEPGIYLLALRCSDGSSAVRRIVRK